LSNELTSIESLVNNYLACLSPPPVVSEAVIDHDYTVLALKRYTEGSKEFWGATLKWMKRVESSVVEPIRAFIYQDIAHLKSLRRSLDISQKNFDLVIGRYSSQSKSKEPSALREDAFQLHEARKSYLKASMDYCVAAPQVKAKLDKLLVRVFSDRWRDMKHSRDTLATSFTKWSGDIDRVKGWSREMENYERVFAQELQMARKQIEESAENYNKPSRDLDSYALSTVPFVTTSTSGPLKSPKPSLASEKQGWLFQRTLTGKPTRTLWVRRWFYVKNGVFGWLAQSPKFSSVEESEKIGVLLCGVRPASQEERRFCFEVKTKDSNIILQTETQAELMEWIAAFEIVKRKALENPDTDDKVSAMQGAPFAISPPIAPEFAAKVHEKDDDAPERATSLAVESPSAGRASMDTRRPVADGDSATRMLSKLGKGGPGQVASGSASPALGGIASLIAASHSALPISPHVPNLSLNIDYKKILAANIPANSLAPSTLANPPVPTNMSKSAIIVGAERGLTLSATGDGGLPGALMANLWGSTNWGRVNRLERSPPSKSLSPERSNSRSTSRPPSRAPSPSPLPKSATMEKDMVLPPPARDLADLQPVRSAPAADGSPLHKRSVSTTMDLKSTKLGSPEEYPNYYPASLKMQDVQFRMLFPTNHHKDRLVMVFRATWNPSDQQEFPGRVYVTMNDVYFYSNHLGLVLITCVSLKSIFEITAAPGKDCDFLFIHLKDGVLLDGATRITVKTFLENQKLLQKRLDYLVHLKQSDESTSLEDVIKALIKMEAQGDESPTLDSWDDSALDFQPETHHSPRKGQDLKTSLHIDGSLQSDPMRRKDKNVTRFKLPPRPVEFIPKGFRTPVLERQYNVTAKSLFHILAGDKSAVFQILYCQRGANSLIQGPWTHPEDGHSKREIRYEVQNSKRRFRVADYQVIDVMTDHLCYVITERKTAWFLPMNNYFTLIMKIVITHVSKSHCKLSLFTTLDWAQTPWIGRSLIEHQAIAYLESYANSLVDIVSEQASKLGVQGGIGARKAVSIFGPVGISDQAIKLSTSDLAAADLKGSKRMKYRSLPRMVLYAVRRVAITYFFVIIGWIWQLIEWSIGLLTAHSVLMLVLAGSISYSLWLSGRETSQWWQERKAGAYMKRLGVSPNTIMGRTVWLRDLDDFSRGNEGELPASGAWSVTWKSLDSANILSSSAFSSILSSMDPSVSPTGYASNITFLSSERNMLSRVSSKRHSFGAHRHDLLVALRLVNRVERDYLQSEMEDWIWREGTRCQHAQRLVQKKQQDGVGSSTELWDGWMNEYCSSCIETMEELKTSIVLKKH
jgi:hypothetical protein